MTIKMLSPLLLMLVFSQGSVSANEFITCAYNRKSIPCRREFLQPGFRIVWQDGVSDNYKLRESTTTTTSTWVDARGGIWNSLTYAGNIILSNSKMGIQLLLEVLMRTALASGTWVMYADNQRTNN